MTKLQASASPSPHVLRPYDPAESIGIDLAAATLCYSLPHTRRIVERYDIGRRILGGAWRVSRIGLLVIADGDQRALDAFHAGRRDDPALRPYAERAVAARVASEAARLVKADILSAVSRIGTQR